MNITETIKIIAIKNEIMITFFALFLCKQHENHLKGAIMFNDDIMSNYDSSSLTYLQEKL